MTRTPSHEYDYSITLCLSASDLYNIIFVVELYMISMSKMN